MSDQNAEKSIGLVKSPIEEDDGPGWFLVVDPEGSGERLDRFISRRLSRVSRSRAARLSVDVLDERGRRTHVKLKKSTRLRLGQRLWIRRPLPPEDLSSLIEPSIVHQDQDLVVINKPSGWVVHPTASHYRSAITIWLKSQEINACPAHRLDLETSGLLVCARSREVDHELKRTFLKREVHKRYLAICEVTERGLNHLEVNARVWRDQTPLGLDMQSEVGLKRGVGELEAQTDFTLILYDQGQRRALVEASPSTGRQHQIRAHLSLAGLPLVGDKLYGPSEELFIRHINGTLTEDDWCTLGHSRHALHASELSLSLRGKLMKWVNPLPQELQSLIFGSSDLAPNTFQNVLSRR